MDASQLNVPTLIKGVNICVYLLTMICAVVWMATLGDYFDFIVGCYLLAACGVLVACEVQARKKFAWRRAALSCSRWYSFESARASAISYASSAFRESSISCLTLSANG
jgi:hypothetical protein